MQTSKNILYIGPYRQSDGWGLAAKGYLLSLLTTNHNICCVPIYLNSSAICGIDDKEILAAENRQYKNYDLIIQKALPPAISPNKYTKNIALIVLENNLLYSDGISNLKQMDEIWVPSKKEQKCLKNSGINNITRSIMQPLPIEDIVKAEEKDIRISFNNSVVDKSYKFYFIGEYIQRKNIEDIIIAFHTEFDIDEPVSLVLKTSVPGLSSDNALIKIKNDIQQIKNKLRTKRKFKNEIIVTDKLSEEQLFAIHRTCDCFVSVSYGEAFCRPAAEAVCFGNPAILTNGIGVSEMINDDDKFMVSTQEQPVVVSDPAYLGGLDIYNANETWCVPSVLDLKKQMRKAFDSKKRIDTKIYREKFNYNTIGEHLCQFM